MTDVVEINGAQVDADFRFEAEGFAPEPVGSEVDSSAPESTVEAMREAGIE